MKIKQWIAAAALLAYSSGFAATYAVWPVATDGEVQIPNDFNYWWNLGNQVVTIDNREATKCWSANGSEAASSGWMTPATAEFDFAVLADKDLTFDAMVEGPGQWNVRLTAADGVESDITISIPADGQFHALRYNVADIWPAVASKWNAGGANGKDIFTFSLSGTGLNGESVLYFTNVRYRDAIPQPNITAEAIDVTYNSATLTWNATFPAGYTNTKVTVNGDEVTGNSLELTGLSERTQYTYTIVAEGDLDGVTYSASQNVIFTTKSSTARNYVYADVLNATFENAFLVGETEADRRNIEAALPWSVTYNDGDKTAVYSIDLSAVEGIVGLVPKVWSYGFFDLTKNNGNGRWEYTFTDKNLNDVTAMSHYLPYAGGVLDKPTGYTFWGMENEVVVPDKGLVMTASAEDITTTTAKIAYSVQATEIDAYTVYYKLAGGEATVATASPIELTGLTARTEYTYEVYAVADDVESNHVSVTFTTARPDGTLPVWYGVTEKEGFTAVYSITYNADKTLTVGAEIETEKETPVADRNFHIYIGGNEWLKLYDNDGTGVLSGTTVSTFEEGTTITWEWYLPYAGGVYQESNQYVVGSENEAPLSLRIKASVDNITTDGAEISYTVTAPAGMDYKVYYKGAGEAVEATTNPIVLTGLAEMTQYTYEVYAVAGDLQSKSAELTFTTKSSTAREYVYADLFAAEFKNAFLPGETEADRRSFFVTLPWKVVYGTDGSAVYSVDLSQVKDFVGLVPQIYWNGFQTLTPKENGVYEYNFGQQELEATTAISHYFAYAGGVVDSRTPYTNWGMEKEAPEIGEATILALSAAKQAAKIGDKVRLSVVAKDANGYYLPVNSVKYDVNGGDFELDNAVFTAKETGRYTITATAGNLSAETEITILASVNSENLIAGMIGVTDEENIQGGSVENVTDDNLTSQLEWKCTDTEEHYLIYDLGGDYYLEGIDLLFEGAYATQFAIRLTNDKPAELEAATPAAARYMDSDKQADDVVFTNEKNDTQHYFIQKPAGTHRYVELRTSKALNTGWGIKVRDLKVYGSDKDPVTGVKAEVQDDANAPVEYYNLQGVRINNPAAGQLVIRRQGTNVAKIVIR